MREPGHRRAVLLLSGGLDSATCLLIAREEGREIFALSFDYAQRHSIELDRARALALRYGVREHRVLRLELPEAGSSALTDPSRQVPRGGLGREPIPITYVPGRNTIFLSLAAAWGEALECGDLFIGANALDYSGYPDCRPDFLDAFERLVNLGTRAAVEGRLVFRVRAPLLRLTKAQIIERAAGLGLDFALTSSCYDPAADGLPCGGCDSCLLRRKGFREAGMIDPLAKAL